VLARAWRAALVERSCERFGSLFSQDAVFVDVEHRTDDLASTREIVGRPAIEEMCRAWLASTPDFDYDVLDVIATRTAGAVRWRYRVEDVELEGVSWLTCANGEIVDARVYFDSLGLYRGLGRV
jgi:hypothetical protein